MQQKSYEIVLLKPSSVFLSFLTAQVPDIKLPDLRLLQIDNTAYALPRHHSDEDTIKELEHSFPTMFRHEICRWLGERARHEIESNFLDFLCCFKFELHNHIILMEPSIGEGRQLLLFKPRIALLHWVQSLAEEQEDLAEVIDRVELSHLQENSTAMVKNFSNLTDIKPFIRRFYPALFATAMTRFTSQSDRWPVLHSFQEFNHYFAVEIHTQLLHLHH